LALPNLFLLGAGKCGTTSLYHLLDRHSEIQVSVPKEPSFFCSYFQVTHNPVEYFQLFREDYKYRVDASHVYFSNPETAPILRDLFPDAKFLIILRHPKARAYSLYQHMRRAIHADGAPIEPISDFHDALLWEEQRFYSRDFFLNCRHYFYNFMYMHSSCFDDQIMRYFNLFSRERFLILTLAELQTQPARTIQRVGDFLGLDPAGFGQDIPLTNQAPICPSYDPASDALMTAYFGDLTARIDRLVGSPLDWSL